MLTRRIIPCLDVRDGRVVKGVRFADLRDAGSPGELAARYEAQGADELVVLDVAATPDARLARADTIAAVRAALSIPLTVGGGVGSVEDGRQLLEAGADKLALNTAAVRDPELITRLAERYGRQCVVLACDAARRRDGDATDGSSGDADADEDASPWEVVVRSGKERTGLDVVAWCAEAQERGAGEVLLTSWDRDGTRAGYDLELLAAVSAVLRVPLIASGGAADGRHLAEALEAGADAVLAASLFHDRDLTVGQVKAELLDAGLEMRT